MQTTGLVALRLIYAYHILTYLHDLHTILSVGKKKCISISRKAQAYAQSGVKPGAVVSSDCETILGRGIRPLQ